MNELSLSLVPRDHPLIPPPNLEAEAFGLLDRLLTLFQEQHSVGVLVQTRPSISQRILNAVLSFNPFRDLPSPISTKTRMVARSIERSIRALLANLAKRYGSHCSHEFC
ncbi:hypothetical protein MRB53_037160 [Persea americana]|nr:hypothetical protein MRB53_037160 [Persea americana]